MSSDDFLQRIEKLSPKRLALLALELHEQLEATRQKAPQPIAVIGMGCRFPGGADDPEAFWRLLSEGRDAIREVPADRWDIDAWFDPDPDAPARMSVRHGGFLDRIDGFDAAFFGISPREAATMDPQQRLALEVSWEALEHAGLSPERLAGTLTGVFLGLCNNDHFHRVIQRGAESIDAYLASGNAHSVASGRVSYFLGLRGPALSIDTACSSSLVALHVACQSLRSGETRVALAGGVNVMCSPETTIALTKAHMLAPDGRCKTFAASADGFARGEGCGVLVLKRLDDAQADGDRVLAVIRGTAANQDGRSGGLTVPNGPSQEAVIRAALEDGGVSAHDVGYVEAHGTGTTLGDPIEVRALGNALAAGRSAGDPLIIGSVKTNLGHLESAAGVAGVMKVILSLLHERIPPHLHFNEPSPHIAWSAHPVKVEAQGRAWPRGKRPRIAGVSSFGFSGTNAHVVIEEPPAPSSTPLAAPRALHCLPLSARSDAALREAARRHAASVSSLDGTATLQRVARTAGVGRSHFAERLAVVTDGLASATDALAAFARGEAHPAVHRGTAQAGQPPEVVFLFTGQGSQYPGMGRALYESSSVFRDVIDRCDELLEPDADGRRLKDVLWLADASAPPAIHQTAWTQPALFALEYALAQLWRSWGVEPAAVIGHSVGEYVAACVAGVFTLEDGLRLIADRGRLMQALPAGGAMAAVFAGADEVSRAIEPMAARLAIAAHNAPDSVVVSGDEEAVDELLAQLARRDIQGQRLFVSLAAHSPRVEPALDAMQACAGKVAMHAPRIPVAWNVTGGEALPGGAPDALYWRRHLREPVRFADGIASLYRQGFRVFLEVGPHPTLVALAQRCLPESDTTWLTSLRRGKDDIAELSASLAALYTRGAAIEWGAVYGPAVGPAASLPTYPFERQSFWVTPKASAPRIANAPAGSIPGARLPTAVPLFETTLTPSAPAWLGEHRVHGAVLVAGPVFMALAQSAAQAVWGPGVRAIESFTIREPLVLPVEGRAVQTSLADEGGGRQRFDIHSRGLDGHGEWRLHASGTLSDSTQKAAQAGAEITGIPKTQGALGAAEPCDAYYEQLHALGIDLGDAFRSLVRAHRRDGEALVQIRLPASAAGDDMSWAHPCLLDGALQSVGIAVPQRAGDDCAHLLTHVDRIDLAAALPETLWCHARVLNARDEQPAEWHAEVTLRSLEGSVLGVIQGVCLRRAPRDALERAVGLGQTSSGLFHRLAWENSPPAARAATFLQPPDRFAAAIRARFGTIAAEQGLAVYDELLPELDALTRDHVGAALRDLGFDATPGRRIHAPAEAARLGIAPRHARLFARLLGMLAEDGTLRRRGDAFEVARALPEGDAAARYPALLERFANTDGELRTLRRCGGELARVMRGAQDPLQLLFPGGSFDEARKLYIESPFARTYNRVLVESMQAAIESVPAGATLRVLEIGAGTGGTTTYVLPALPAQRTEYTFTDLSPLFLERAAEQFAAYPFVRRELLDIERDPLVQGFQAGSYDIVIAANVLHATADLRQTLGHARKLMAPGAMLLLLEGVAPERWVDLTFGLTEGWWRFTDTALRPDYPLIGRNAWLAALRDLGFVNPVAVPDASAAGRGTAQQALMIARAPSGGRRRTIIGNPDGMGEALAGRLRARGDVVTLVPLVSAAAPATLAACDDAIYLGAIELAGRAVDDAGAASDAKTLACVEPLRWLKATVGSDARMFFVTRGVHAAGGAPACPAAALQGPLWGLGRGFALEHPDRWGGLVDLPFAQGADMVETLVKALDSDDGEDQSAWREGTRYVARLLPDEPPAVAVDGFAPDATYLVTGGFGGLGLVVADWLVERGARHVALLGRRAQPHSQAVRDLEAKGATVHSLSVDVADAGAMSGALARLRERAPPLRGVFHAAAALNAAPLASLAPAQVDEMLAPKIDGSLVLERVTRDAGVEFLVLFSSTTALLGASGLAHYAAANAFLDALAHATDDVSGRRVLSVNWGTWEVMRLASAESQASYREGGLLPMPARDALGALGRALAGPASQVVVARVDWSALKNLHEARRARPLLSRLGAPPQTVAPAVRRPEAGPSLVQRLSTMPAGMRGDALVNFVQAEAAAVLGVADASSVPVATGLFDLGMDSLMSVELKRRLERGTGLSLPSTLTFNYPNVAALARFLGTQVVVAAGPAKTPPMPTPSPSVAPAPASVITSAVDLDALSDEELEARLLARLEETR
jgi:acyl transferase domain-containing protein/SAM-dependent methyltransferase/acyl carrier protein